MECSLFIDSSPALYWLRKQPDSLKTFVANRVASIQRNTRVECWRYVNTKDNPADMLSRGIKPSELVNNKLWLHGPQWLSLPKSEWPPEQFPMKIPETVDLELKVCSISEYRDSLSLDKWNADEEVMERVPLLDYVDDLDRALRILAFIIRYIIARIAKYKPPKVNTRSKKQKIEPPSKKEKAHAMEYFQRKAQEQHYNAELTALRKGKPIPEKSKLVALNPRLDSRGLMRVGGRLEKAAIDPDRKHLVIIPKQSRLAWLLMARTHKQHHHAHTQVIMHHVRQRYWIPQLRSEVKRFIRQCVTCVRNKPLTLEQLMACGSYQPWRAV